MERQRFADLGVRSGVEFADGFADRHAGQDGFAAAGGIFGFFEAGGHHGRIASQKTVGAAHNRILFVNNQIGAEQNSCHGAGKGGISAETDDASGPVFENDPHRLQNADRGFEQAFDFKPFGFAH